MTTTYDPHHPSYLDDGDLREELTRVFDVCHGCRLCLPFCGTFPTLFELIDRRDDEGAGGLTRAEQDRVVDECFQCKLCYVSCPYIPGRSDRAVDFPRLMLRAEAIRYTSGEVDRRERLTTNVIARTDLLGKVASRTATLANATTAKPGSVIRKVIEKATGVSSVRLLPPFARERFTTWFHHRPRVRLTGRRGQVAVFPTCLVEYQNPAIGQDLVKVYEHNGVECSLTEGAGCCGAPWLHSGDLDSFTKAAVKNVKLLAAEVRAGNEIVVPQPTCSYVLRQDYVDYVGGPDAELVAAHTFDASEYLMRLHKGEGTALDTEFRGEVPREIAYHTPCHLRAQNIGLKSRDLMRLTGSRIKLVQQCSGIDGMWGLRAENAERSILITKKLAAELERAGGDVVAGDCHLANTAITEQTGRIPQHPIQVMARAYGIPPERPR
ncbi:MAG TPA: heterodisulfide reductase-related iron-sulfur binding cluster [Acidimicrobiales bacterium]